ncbi:enoyl-CoA hydratase [Trinickia mobilis]|uniref:enoyl-CoA hydratase n=1 Tax=Trinickia mobilis TaxID=2816356 RepID=UPI001A9055D7|nr:enoyl-CoA hydratase [Trinickia mobilis]
MSDILTKTASGILTITINRPEKKNSITASMYEMLAQVLRDAAGDAQVRTVVVSGSEQIFSAGNDLGDFVKNPPNTQEAPVWQFLRALSAFPKPVVAAVCGAAVGIGTTMLLHCDLVFAGENARFSLPFVNLGLCPEAASSLLLPKLAGYQRAARALLTGDAFDANTALQMGLVNQVLPVEETFAFAQQEAVKLAAKPLGAIVETKRLLKAGDRAATQDRINEEAAVFGKMVTDGAAQEAIAAFAEKRKPDFSRF